MEDFREKKFYFCTHSRCAKANFAQIYIELKPQFVLNNIKEPNKLI